MGYVVGSSPHALFCHLRPPSCNKKGGKARGENDDDDDKEKRNSNFSFSKNLQQVLKNENKNKKDNTEKKFCCIVR